MRIEGTDDILDIESVGLDGAVVRGQQIKTRVQHRAWGKAPILAALQRWLALDLIDAEFEFVTREIVEDLTAALAEFEAVAAALETGASERTE